MSQQQFGAGAKWFFWLAIVVFVIIFALGFNVKDAKWVNGRIANATAEQINLTTDIARQKADLELQTLKAQTEIQIEQQKQQAEIVTARQHQALEAQATANLQWAEFRNNIYTTFNLGLLTVMVAGSIVLVVLGVNAGLGVNRILLARAKAIQHAATLEQRKIVIAMARELERSRNVTKITSKQRLPHWSSDDGNTVDLVPTNHSRTN